MSRLVGAPPGYVGYEEGGQLTERIRKKPYAVVLLDEIEKAHPDVFNLLLQILDEGHLTDSFGRRVNFRNTIIIMTSNLGARDIKRGGLGFSNGSDESTYERMERGVQDELKRTFNPEFINRLDEIVVFHPLGEDHIKSIARIQLKSLMGRLESQGFEVEVSEELLTKLVHAGFDPVYGARPLKRAIQQKVENPLAQALLSGRVIPGKKLLLGADSNGLTMSQP